MEELIEAMKKLNVVLDQMLESNRLREKALEDCCERLDMGSAFVKALNQDAASKFRTAFSSGMHAQIIDFPGGDAA